MLGITFKKKPADDAQDTSPKRSELDVTTLINKYNVEAKEVLLEEEKDKDEEKVV